MLHRRTGDGDAVVDPGGSRVETESLGILVIFCLRCGTLQRKSPTFRVVGGGRLSFTGGSNAMQSCQVPVAVVLSLRMYAWLWYICTVPPGATCSEDSAR